MFSRNFARAPKSWGPRRRIREEMIRERRIALQQRWYVGALATVVAGALVFTGVTPAVADEVIEPSTEQTQETTPAQEPAPAEEAPAPEAPAEEAPAEEAPAEETPAEESDTAAPAPVDEAKATQESAEAAPLAALAAPDAAALAVLACETVGGFEIDGNYAPGDCGGSDWTSVGYSSSAFVGTYQVVKDNSNPATWNRGGGTPPKIDFIRNYTFAQTVGDDYYLYVGWDREQTSGTGGYVIEVTNAGATFAPDGAPRPNRANGGAVFYITTQGSNPPVLLQACVYASVATYPGICDSSPSAAGFVGAVSSEELTNPFGTVIESGGFFEVGMNVTELTGGIVAPGCPASATATTYMRSFTGNNFGPTGNLKGFVGPTAVEPPSTCGSLTIVKENEDGDNLAGAQFTVTPNPTTGSGSAPATTDASGTFTFSGTVIPGNYTVTETVPPAGYLLPTPATQNAVVVTGQTTTVTFVDPLGSLTWSKVDRAGAPLGGATFSVTATAGAAAAAPWELDTNPITVVDNTGQGGYTGRDTDPAPGAFTVTDLPTGTYSVAETQAPPLYVLDPTPQVAVIAQATPHPVIATAFVNTPYATVTVKKAWVDAFPGDTATLSVTGGQNAVDTAPGSGATSTVQVAPGTTVTVSETLGGGNTGLYDAELSCIGAQPSEDDGSPAQVTVPAWPASADGVECTFTNTARTTTITLKKEWVDGVLGDSVDARIDIGDQQNPTSVSFLSVSNGDAGSWTDPASVGAIVRIGETFSITESYPVAPEGSYASSWVCTGVASGPSTTSNTSIPAGMKAPATPTTCTFTNVNNAFNVVVVKEWINGEAGDSALLEVAGSAQTETSFSNGDLGPWIDAANVLTVPVNVGTDVVVSEEISVVAGDASDYTSTWECVDGAYYQNPVGVPVFEASGTGREIEFDMPSIAVVCTFTNEAEAPTLELLKDVEIEGVEVSDDNWQLFGELTSGVVVTNPAGGDVEATEIEAGIDVALSEELIGEFEGSDEFEPSEWSCVLGDEEIALEDSEVGSATLPGLGKGDDVVCTITNTHIDQGYEFEKTFVDSVQGEGGGWTVTYAITVVNNSVLVPVDYDLVDTLDPVDGDLIAYTGASWTGPTSGDFDLETLQGQLADGETLAAGGDAEYIVTVELTVDGVPEGAGPCPDRSLGIGIVNSAEITVDGESVESEACGTVHFDDVSLVKTAGLPDGETSVEPGDTFDYVLTVTNNGTRTATDVRVLDDSLFERLAILGLTVEGEPGTTWGPEPGYSDNVVDLTIDEIGAGESVVVTITVLFFSPDPVLVDHDGDPETDPVFPPLVNDDEVPVPPGLVDVLVNTACVEMEGDQDGENDCDTVEVPTRDITALLYTRCVNDAPFLGWSIAKSALLQDEPIDFTWTPTNPDVTPETTPSQVTLTQPGGSLTWAEEIPWPGSAFTPSGISIDYPGWRPLEAADYAPEGGFYLPGTTDVMTPEEEALYVFNGLILDPSELDFAWRGLTTIEFTVNPTLTFTTGYPPATPECFVARHTEVQVEKTASVERTEPGGSFTYDLAVSNVSDDSAAEGVIVTDEIPADIKITDVSWPGEGDAAVFPNWETCAVSGQDGAGYGGTLECVLFGPLQPMNSDNGGATVAPTITLSATVNPSATSSVITNIAVVDYYTFGDPEDPGRDSDDATVLLSALPATGGETAPLLVILGLLALLGGVTTLIVVRRRRGEAKLTL